ncbi:MAG: Gfo/Idh/MocA family oxidoreductase [Spirochaetaceae bacterium]|jgi:predicted dehydrogenase|nr:Gfo/Idh/MocA family oxidoreductase [Spirochaetaceae bacterium]
MEKQRVGIVGLGKISGIYLQNLTGLFGSRVRLTAVTDLIRERGEAVQAEYHIPFIPDAETLIRSPDVDIVLNITQPQHHYGVAKKAIEAGKHVYNEKPLCVTREEAADLLGLAAARKVRVGGAPDTFLGAGIQTCRKLIDDGWIGRPIAATAFMMNHGHEHWHPDPEFYYKTGGGPLFDMGPYYLTALVNLLGPIVRVSGSAKQGFKQRTVTSEPQRGKVITVDVPTHIAATLDFTSGAVGTLITSFDVYSHTLPFIEIYGSEGTLRAPDPNTFGGPVLVSRFREEAWSQIPLLGDYAENSRGLGITDMAAAITEGRLHRASGELTNHVLEVMHGIHDASRSGVYYPVKSTCSRPEVLGKEGL